MDWTADTSGRLREIATWIMASEEPEPWLASSALGDVASRLDARVALLEQTVREDWTLMKLDYDPSEVMDEFKEAVEDFGAEVVDEGPDHIRMDVPRGREDEFIELSEAMADGDYGPELEEFALAYGV